MSGQWFLTKNDLVQGPLAAEDIEARLQRGEIAPSDMICGTGMTTWNQVSWWKTELPKLMNFRPALLPDIEAPVRARARASDSPTQIIRLPVGEESELATALAIKIEPATAAITVVTAPAEPWANSGSSHQTVVTHVKADAPTVQLRVQESTTPRESWHYALEGQTHGPFDHAGLIKALETAEPLHEVSLWTRGMREWAPIYEFHEILSELNANKRSFPRAELDGKVVLSTGDQDFHAQILTISEGGLGIRLEVPPKPGTKCSCEIQSPMFAAPISAQVEVRFSVGGVTGLRFIMFEGDAKNQIGEFLRQTFATRAQRRAA